MSSKTTVSKTAIPERNSWLEAVTCSSIQAINGRKGNAGEPKSSLSSIPDLEEAYSLTHSLRMIFNKRSTMATARLNMTRWYNKVEETGFHSFNVIAATF